MAFKLWCRSGDGTVLTCKMFAYQDNDVEVPGGGAVAASTLNACSKASYTFPGADSNGDVSVTAFYGGAPDNALRVSLETGPTGAGNEDLPLRVDVQGAMPSQQVSVLFATDGAGASITPTAAAVADLLNSDLLTAEVVEAAAGGTGLSSVAAAGLTSLSGGLDDGDRVALHGIGDRYVHRIEVI